MALTTSLKPFFFVNIKINLHIAPSVSIAYIYKYSSPVQTILGTEKIYYFSVKNIQNFMLHVAYIRFLSPGPCKLGPHRSCELLQAYRREKKMSFMIL